MRLTRLDLWEPVLLNLNSFLTGGLWQHGLFFTKRLPFTLGSRGRDEEVDVRPQILKKIPSVLWLPVCRVAHKLGLEALVSVAGSCWSSFFTSWTY